jgi:hypothetical protein
VTGEYKLWDVHTLKVFSNRASCLAKLDVISKSVHLAIENGVDHPHFYSYACVVCFVLCTNVLPLRLRGVHAVCCNSLNLEYLICAWLLERLKL